MRNIDLANIQFITTPWEPAGDRVTPLPDAAVLWNAIANDHAVTSSTDELGTITIQDLVLNPPSTAAPAPEDETGNDAPTAQESAPAEL